MFDNRLYGYNAIVDPPNNLSEDLKFSLIKTNKKNSEILVKIRNDLSIEEYIETMKGTFMEKYSEAFSDISIYSITDGRKNCFLKKKLHNYVWTSEKTLK